MDINNLSLLKYKNLSQEEFNQIVDYVASNKIDGTIAIEVLKTIPNLVKLNETYLETTKTIFNSAKDIQLSAIDKISIQNIDKIIGTIESMSKDTSEEFKKECLSSIILLSQKLFEFEKDKNDTTAKINDDNNGLWKKAFMALSLVVVSVGAIAAGIANKGK
ncbi:hypothetical protein [Aliarcobacter butzleri]|uniref:Uncharacterized protein n=2 Tax=root TaxID=1 RepID=A0A0G9KP10_9BACT|nr:hypothetical protein [Aliarcobacter butzleri]KLE08181.1 hypothetical protein AF80_10325 [Aliarcobacter butzleri L355]MCG3692174.1 hypothetical protein [Aliarcobacter butzleri]